MFKKYLNARESRQPRVIADQVQPSFEETISVSDLSEELGSYKKKLVPRKIDKENWSYHDSEAAQKGLKLRQTCDQNQTQKNVVNHKIIIPSPSCSSPHKQNITDTIPHSSENDSPSAPSPSRNPYRAEPNLYKKGKFLTDPFGEIQHTRSGYLSDSSMKSAPIPYSPKHITASQTVKTEVHKDDQAKTQSLITALKNTEVELRSTKSHLNKAYSKVSTMQRTIEHLTSDKEALQKESLSNAEALQEAIAKLTQAKRAHNDLEYKLGEINLHSSELKSNYEFKVKDYEVELNRKNSALSEKQENLTRCFEKISVLERNIDNLLKENEELKQALNNKNNLVKSQEISLLNATSKFQQYEIDNRNALYMEQKITSLEDELKNYRATDASKTETIENLREIIQQYEHKVNKVADLEKDLENAFKYDTIKNSTIEELKNEVKTYISSNDSLKLELSYLEDKYSAKCSVFHFLENEKETLSNQLNEMQSILDCKEEQLVSLGTDFSEAQIEIQTLNESLSEKVATLEAQAIFIEEQDKMLCTERDVSKGLNDKISTIEEEVAKANSYDVSLKLENEKNELVKCLEICKRELEKQSEQNDSEVRNLQNQLSLLEDEYSATTGFVTGLEREKLFLLEQIKILKREGLGKGSRAATDQEVEYLKRDIDMLKESIFVKNSKIEMINAEKLSTELKLREAQNSQLEATSVRDEIQKELMELIHDNYLVKEELSNTSQALETAQQNLHETYEKLRELEVEKLALERNKSVLEDDLWSYRDELRSLQKESKEHKRLKLEKSQLQDDINLKNSRMSALEADKRQLQNEISRLQDENNYCTKDRCTEIEELELERTSLKKELDLVNDRLSLILLENADLSKKLNNRSENVLGQIENRKDRTKKLYGEPMTSDSITSHGNESNATAIVYRGADENTSNAYLAEIVSLKKEVYNLKLREDEGGVKSELHQITSLKKSLYKAKKQLADSIKSESALEKDLKEKEQFILSLKEELEVARQKINEKSCMKLLNAVLASKDKKTDYYSESVPTFRSFKQRDNEDPSVASQDSSAIKISSPDTKHLLANLEIMKVINSTLDSEMSNNMSKIEGLYMELDEANSLLQKQRNSIQQLREEKTKDQSELLKINAILNQYMTKLQASSTKPLNTPEMSKLKSKYLKSKNRYSKLSSEATNAKLFYSKQIHEQSKVIDELQSQLISEVSTSLHLHYVVEDLKNDSLKVMKQMSEMRAHYMSLDDVSVSSALEHVKKISYSSSASSASTHLT